MMPVSALNVLFGLPRLIELRWLGKHRMSLITSDLNLIDNALDSPEVCDLDGYLTVNALGDVAKRGLPLNTLYRPSRGQCVSDSDIENIIRLPFDFDPVRPTGTAATLDQIARAVEMRDRMIAYLAGRGWPAPLGDVFSGNGRHTYFKTDLPNTPEVSSLLYALYYALAQKFDVPGVVKLDKSVRSPAQIMRLPGTLNRKAQRQCEIISVSEDAAPVTLQHIRDAITDLRGKIGKGPLVVRVGDWTPARMQALLDFHGLDYLAPREIPLGTMWVLCPCPFNEDHKLTSPAAFVTRSGFPRFKCRHDSCSKNGWRQFLAHLNLRDRKVFLWKPQASESKSQNS
jgi:hypothetical protein